MKNSSQLLPIGIGGGAALLLLLGGFFFWQNHSASPSDVPLIQPAVAVAASTIPEGYVRRLSDGVPVPPEQQPTRWFAVMVENSAEAWPLAGIGQARLVIEAPVEGHIPRMSAYFDDKQEVKKIGPVRSLRPYYLDWAMGEQAMVAHVGGSPDALSLVNVRASADLNEFWWGRFFWRSLDRYAPHNVYTSVGLLMQGFDARGYTATDAIPSFTYADAESAVADRPQQQTIVIPFSSATTNYDAGWVYDRAQNSYVRQQGGKAFNDADEEPIIAKNVVVVYTKITTLDDVGRLSVKTIGDGKVDVFRDGLRIEGVWKKDAIKSPWVFETEDGEAIALNAGTTWIEVIPLSTEISVKTE